MATRSRPGRLTDDPEPLAVVRGEGTRLLAVVRSDRGRAVPTYPCWTLADLLAHTGSVHRWVAGIVRSGARPVSPREPPAERGAAALLDWYAAGLDDLVAVLVGADPEAPVWTLLGDGQVRFWRQRMAHETAVHRWDAEFAVGAATPFTPALAAGGIAETLRIHVVRPLRGQAVGDGRGLVLACTDTPGAWTVRATPDGVDVTTGRATAAAEVAGPASALWLYLMGRPADGLRRSGEAAVIDRFEQALVSTSRPTF